MNCATLPDVFHSSGMAGVKSLFSITLSQAHLQSLAVNGSPSDHFTPLRRKNVNSFASELITHRLARLGIISCPFISYSRRPTPIVRPNLPTHPAIVGFVNTDPYFPIAFKGVTTRTSPEAG